MKAFFFWTAAGIIAASIICFVVFACLQNTAIMAGCATLFGAGLWQLPKLWQEVEKEKIEKEKIVLLLIGYCETLNRGERPTPPNVANHCSLTLDEVNEYTKIAYDKGFLEPEIYDTDYRRDGAPRKYFYPTKKGRQFLLKHKHT